MEKKDVVLVVMNRDALEETVQNLNLDCANLTMIVVDGYDGKTFSVGGNEIPVTPFATIHATIRKYKKIFWLIGGGSAESLRKMKRILTTNGIPGNNVVNFEHSQLSATWLANVRHIVEHGADFFVTGNEYTQVGVNLKLIPHVQADTAARRGGCTCRRRSNIAAKPSYGKTRL